MTQSERWQQIEEKRKELADVQRQVRRIEKEHDKAIQRSVMLNREISTLLSTYNALAALEAFGVE